MEKSNKKLNKKIRRESISVPLLCKSNSSYPYYSLPLLCPHILHNMVMTNHAGIHPAKSFSYIRRTPPISIRTELIQFQKSKWSHTKWSKWTIEFIRINNKQIKKCVSNSSEWILPTKKTENKTEIICFLVKPSFFFKPSFSTLDNYLEEGSIFHFPMCIHIVRVAKNEISLFSVDFRPLSPFWHDSHIVWNGKKKVAEAEKDTNQSQLFKQTEKNISIQSRYRFFIGLVQSNIILVHLFWKRLDKQKCAHIIHCSWHKRYRILYCESRLDASNVNTENLRPTTQFLTAYLSVF